jgi:hypothetical protein
LFAVLFFHILFEDLMVSKCGNEAKIIFTNCSSFGIYHTSVLKHFAATQYIYQFHECIGQFAF